MKLCRREPTLDELLADPVTKAVMEADGVDPHELAATLKYVVQARTQLNMRRPVVIEGPPEVTRVEHLFL